MSDLAPGGTGDRLKKLEEALQERILVLDGATGTALQAMDLTAEDFGGPALEGCNENLVLTRPDVCAKVHASYLAAGCDVVETNTFGATPLVLGEYGLSQKAREINAKAARIAREVCARFESKDRPRWVAGSMGPTTKAISVTGGVTFEELIAHFRVQALGLTEGGADYLLLETCQDTRNVKAGIIGIQEAFRELGRRIPVAVSGTIESTGTMLAGQGVDALYVSLMHADLLYVGLNCATGPAFMTDHVRSLSEIAGTRVACVPNAGLPDEEGRYGETPERMTEVIARFLAEGWVNLVGGCCGTTDHHVAALVKAVAGKKPRAVPATRRTWLSGIEFLEVGEDVRPVIVGEKTNILGSRKFKRLVKEKKWEEAAEIARAQVKSGAHMIDVCLQDPDEDEVANVRAFLDLAIRVVKVPLVIDSTDAKVMEAALTYSQGKALLNSVNLENGLERFEQVVPLAKRFGAALVVGCIDEDPKQGMAVTAQRKLEVARRSHKILTEDFGIPEEDLVFDPLVFPCGTGDQNYVGSARETIEGVRLLKKEFPRSKTVLGISNVSFGLPEAGREILNSVFLHHCVQAGLDIAIVNSERLERYPSIPEVERRLSEDLIDFKGADPIAAFTAHFRERAPKEKRSHAGLPLAERLAAYVVEGTKEGLVEDLDEALKSPDYPNALDIVNGPLMAGMAEVGRMFAANELIVAEVLQSASAMKAAVSHLEPHMEKKAGSRLGKIVLATVKGDVHDIGKNLVDIVLSNNGYEVVNLGIKIPSEVLIEAVKEHRPDLLGLSGLLVKSAQMMVTTAQDLANAGIRVPLLVGGAALSPAFTYRKIAPAYGAPVAYARDAMNGLALAGRFRDPARLPALLEEIEGHKKKAAVVQPAPTGAPAVPRGRRSPAVRADVDLPPAPPLDRVVLREIELDEVWSWLNPQMLYGKHLGLRGSVARLADAGDRKYRMLEQVVDHVKDLSRKGGMHVRAVYRWFPVRAEGETVRVFDPESGGEIERFTFPRQRSGEGLSIADYVMATDDRPGGPVPDHVGFFVTTAGEGIRDQVARLREAGQYLESHALGALAVESAEAAAEWLHARMRTAWGFPDPDGLAMAERFRCDYRGCRYSFGYPACPDLSDQARLFRLLRPQEIGVELTEGFMMDPEASVSALVFHHPQARYFSVGPVEEEAEVEESV